VTGKAIIEAGKIGIYHLNYFLPVAFSLKIHIMSILLFVRDAKIKIEVMLFSDVD
jgi:hypothetical protein